MRRDRCCGGSSPAPAARASENCASSGSGSLATVHCSARRRHPSMSSSPAVASTSAGVLSVETLRCAPLDRAGDRIASGISQRKRIHQGKTDSERLAFVRRQRRGRSARSVLRRRSDTVAMPTSRPSSDTVDVPRDAGRHILNAASSRSPAAAAPCPADRSRNRDGARRCPEAAPGPPDRRGPCAYTSDTNACAPACRRRRQLAAARAAERARPIAWRHLVQLVDRPRDAVERQRRRHDARREIVPRQKRTVAEPPPRDASDAARSSPVTRLHGAGVGCGCEDARRRRAHSRAPDRSSRRPAFRERAPASAVRPRRDRRGTACPSHSIRGADGGQVAVPRRPPEVTASRLSAGGSTGRSSFVEPPQHAAQVLRIPVERDGKQAGEQRLACRALERADHPHARQQRNDALELRRRDEGASPDLRARGAVASRAAAAYVAGRPNAHPFERHHQHAVAAERARRHQHVRHVGRRGLARTHAGRMQTDRGARRGAGCRPSSSDPPAMPHRSAVVCRWRPEHPPPDPAGSSAAAIERATRNLVPHGAVGRAGGIDAYAHQRRGEVVRLARRTAVT